VDLCIGGTCCSAQAYVVKCLKPIALLGLTHALGVSLRISLSKRVVKWLIFAGANRSRCWSNILVEMFSRFTPTHNPTFANSSSIFYSSERHPSWVTCERLAILTELSIPSDVSYRSYPHMSALIRKQSTIYALEVCLSLPSDFRSAS
jgi:hypothetical protein